MWPYCAMPFVFLMWCTGMSQVCFPFCCSSYTRGTTEWETNLRHYTLEHFLLDLRQRSAESEWMRWLSQHLADISSSQAFTLGPDDLGLELGLVFSVYFCVFHTCGQFVSFVFFFEFLVYFFLSVLCCQYQCNWLPGKTLSLNWPAMFHSLDRKVVTPGVSSVASLPYVR